MTFKFKIFARKYRLDILLILLILGLFPFFFYKLGQSSLVSWDEAWYADIARNIVKTGNLLRLYWNGKLYFDHPPVGFWWMALSFKIFGISNFSARAASAIFGLMTLVATYLLGKKLFGRWVGVASALALASCPWFLYRARSGNLDIFLTFFFVLSFYLAFKSLENKKFYLWLGISLGVLFLTKTAAPITITPALVAIYIGKKVEWKWVIKGFVGFGILVGSWFVSLSLLDAGFIKRYFYIGTPGVNVKTSYADNIKLMKQYIHSGIGRWFWPGVASIAGGIATFQRSFIVLSIFCLSFTFPFIFSNRGQIWHYVPLYPFMILLFFGLSRFLILKFFNKEYLAAIIILICSAYFSFNQLKIAWFQFINISSYISDEEILSKEASKYPGNLIVDGDFVPAAIFYSGKSGVSQTYAGGLKEVFEKNDKLLLITKQQRLDGEKISPEKYQVIKSDRDKILVKKI